LNQSESESEPECESATVVRVAQCPWSERLGWPFRWFQLLRHVAPTRYGDQTFSAGEHLAPGFSQWRLALAA
jgi:hypothetical protein